MLRAAILIGERKKESLGWRLERLMFPWPMPSRAGICVRFASG